MSPDRQQILDEPSTDYADYGGSNNNLCNLWIVAPSRTRRKFARVSASVIAAILSLTTYSSIASSGSAIPSAKSAVSIVFRSLALLSEETAAFRTPLASAG